MPPEQSIKLTIAGITLKVMYKGHVQELPDAYQGFVTPNGGPLVQILRVSNEPLPTPQFRRLVFRVGEHGWTLHIDAQGRSVFDIPKSATGHYARRLASFTPDFRTAQVYAQLSEELPQGTPYPFPLEYPLDRLATLGLLAQGYGIMLHAAAVVECGEATVFSGPSGAGKSTIARLYSLEEGSTVLNDDTIIVRKIEGQFWAFGTPWHGSTPACSPLGAPISRIYAIEHATMNVATAMEEVDAATTLLTRATIPFHHPEGVAFTLDFVAELAERVPCYRLGFVPNASAISYIHG